MLQHQIPGDGV